MTEPEDASPERATGASGVPGGRRDAGVPGGSTVPGADAVPVARPPVDVPSRPAASDPTTSSLSEMTSGGEEPTRPREAEPVTDSGATDAHDPTGTAPGS